MMDNQNFGQISKLVIVYQLTTYTKKLLKKSILHNVTSKKYNSCRKPMMNDESFTYKRVTLLVKQKSKH